MDRIARWYPAFFLNCMLGALLTRLTISHQSDVRIQMFMHLLLASVQLVLNILAWTIQQFTADATNWIMSCGRGQPLDVETKRRLLTDDSKIRAILFECKQFSESWAIVAVFAANLVYAFTLNCPLLGGYKRNDYVGHTNLLNLINATTVFQENVDDENRTTYTPVTIRDEIYQDPFAWSDGHMLVMTCFQLALELPVDILSTRALELLRQPVFSALRPHLGNVRVMYGFQVFLSLAMMSIIINFKHEIVFGKLLHEIDCTDDKVMEDCRSPQVDRVALGLVPSVANKETRSGWVDPLDVCCYHTQNDEVLHACNKSQEGYPASCWIESKDASLVVDTLGPTNGDGGQNDPLLRAFHLLEALAFGWGTLIAGVLLIPNKAQSDAVDVFEFNGKIRKAVDAGMKTRTADEFLTALELDDYVYPLEHEFGITRVSDLWQVDPTELESERQKVRLALDTLLKAEDATGGGTVKLSELVIRDRLNGVTEDDIENLLKKFSPNNCASEDDVQLWLDQIRTSQQIHGRVIPEHFDNWVEELENGSANEDVQHVMGRLKDRSKQRVRTYLVEVTTSAQATIGDRTPEVHIEFFGGHEESSEAATKDQRNQPDNPMVYLPHHRGNVEIKAAPTESEGPYLVGGRVYARSSDELDLAKYHQIQLPGVHRLNDQLFQPGSTVAFEVRTPDIGEVTAVRVWLANDGAPLSWQCEMIGITCTQTMIKRVFHSSQHISKGEVYTQKITGKLLMAQRPTEDKIMGSDSPPRRSLQVSASEAQLNKTFSDLEQHPEESHRGHAERTQSMPVNLDGQPSLPKELLKPETVEPSGSGEGRPTEGIWSQMLDAGPADVLPRQLLLEMCQLHTCDVLSHGKEPPISAAKLEEVLESCPDNDDGQVGIREFSVAVAKTLARAGFTQDDATAYFKTRPAEDAEEEEIHPAWHTEASLHSDAACTYSIALQTSDIHKVRPLPPLRQRCARPPPCQ